MDEVQQLSLAKQFADDADRQLSRRDDYGNGQAVSLTQDAVELIVRAACRHRGVTITDKATIADMIRELDAHEQKSGLSPTPHAQRVRDITVSRNGFKHRGIAVTQADAERFVRYGVDFAEVAVPQFFALEWKSLSLADAIRDEAVRSVVKLAESYLAQEQFDEALVESAAAVRILEHVLERLIPVAVWRGEFDANRATADYLNGLRLISLSALVQIDVRDLLRFRSLGVNVHTSASGQRQVTRTRVLHAEPEHALFAVEFARSFALAVQTRLA